MPGLFVTATGTEVGKTYVTAGLIRAARRAGIAVEALKPVMTGSDAAALTESDAGVLLAALGRPVTPATVAEIAPFRFAAPLAPSMAAPMEGRVLDVAAVIDACRASVRPDALTFIEGIGGVMVPLDERRTVLDLIEALALPVVLVSGTQLGALSHCLASHEVLVARGCQPSLVVISESSGSTVPLDETRDTLGDFVGAPSVLRRDASESDFDALFSHLRMALDRRSSRAFRSLA